MTIKEAQELIETWTAKNNVRNNELTNMALLTEEIGKLTRVMVRRFNDHANEPNFRYEVSDEIGDILGVGERRQPDGRRPDRIADQRPRT